MENIEYFIGRLEINPMQIDYEGQEPYESDHKFVVHYRLNRAGIYVAATKPHPKVVRMFQLNEEEIVGGGNVYLDKDNALVIDEYSGKYKAIPNNAARRFAELIFPEFVKMGFNPSGIKIDMDEDNLNPFWK